MDTTTVVNGHWVAAGGTHIEGCRSGSSGGMIQVAGGWQCWSCHTPVFLPRYGGRTIAQNELVALDAPAPGCVCKECRAS